MYFPVWCISQFDVFPSLMYFPVWWNCISPWISSCRLCSRWCRAECVLSGGTTRPKGSSHFALQKAAVLGTSTCIYLTAARSMSTSIYPLKLIFNQFNISSTSASLQLHISSTSAPHQLNISSTLAPYQLHISSSSALHQLHISSKSTPNQLQISSSSLEQITLAHHFSTLL